MKIHCQYSELVEVAGLKEHPKNSNKHPTDQIERLARILEYQGWRYPVKVSKRSGYVTSGHGRILAAKLNGWREVPVSFQDYDDETQEIADVTSDNAIASWAELDLGTINAFVPDLGPDFDLDLLGIKDFTLDAQDKYQGDEDAVPETPIEPKVKRGELWILGEHKLLIDDCTVKENVERLMGGEKADMVFTDPPYGISLDRAAPETSGTLGDGRARRQHAFAPIHGDEGLYDATKVLSLFSDCGQVFLWGANNYAHSVPISSWICWDRKGTESGDKSLVSDFELCWSKDPHKYAMIRIVWHGPFGHNKKTDGDRRVHPSQKPVKLAEQFFERWGKDAVNIWDGYLGSGTTLIACEKSNRKCFGCEIDPTYAEAIINRWQKFTGREAVREDGVKYADLD